MNPNLRRRAQMRAQDPNGSYVQKLHDAVPRVILPTLVGSCSVAATVLVFIKTRNSSIVKTTTNVIRRTIRAARVPIEPVWLWELWRRRLCGPAVRTRAGLRRRCTRGVVLGSVAAVRKLRWRRGLRTTSSNTRIWRLSGTFYYWVSKREKDNHSETCCGLHEPPQDILAHCRIGKNPGFLPSFISVTQTVQIGF